MKQSLTQTRQLRTQATIFYQLGAPSFLSNKYNPLPQATLAVTQKNVCKMYENIYIILIE